MAKRKNKVKSGNVPAPIVFTTSDLPGMEDLKVIVSSPILIRENSSKPSN